MHIIYINIRRQRVKVAIVCTISVRTHLVMIPVLIASPLLSDRALIEGILKDLCHWSSPVIADTGLGA